jgi:hypothetical protein
MAAKRTKRKRLSSFEWNELAYLAAFDAYEDNFQTRRGIWFDQDSKVWYLYNNNPYASDPTLRDQETDEFRRRLKEAGIKELAYATYPDEGEEDAGYTYAMLIEAGEEKADWITETMIACIRESYRKMKERTRELYGTNKRSS